jgi:hypothetical protein
VTAVNSVHSGKSEVDRQAEALAMLDLRVGGQSVDQIAAHFKVSFKTVHRRLNSAINIRREQSADNADHLRRVTLAGYEKSISRYETLIGRELTNELPDLGFVRQCLDSQSKTRSLLQRLMGLEIPVVQSVQVTHNTEQDQAISNLLAQFDTEQPQEAS